MVALECMQGHEKKNLNHAASTKAFTENLGTHLEHMLAPSHLLTYSGKLRIADEVKV